MIVCSIIQQTMSMLYVFSFVYALCCVLGISIYILKMQQKNMQNKLKKKTLCLHITAHHKTGGCAQLRKSVQLFLGDNTNQVVNKQFYGQLSRVIDKGGCHIGLRTFQLKIQGGTFLMTKLAENL